MYFSITNEQCHGILVLAKTSYIAKTVTVRCTEKRGIFKFFVRQHLDLLIASAHNGSYAEYKTDGTENEKHTAMYEEERHKECYRGCNESDAECQQKIRQMNVIFFILLYTRKCEEFIRHAYENFKFHVLYSLKQLAFAKYVIKNNTNYDSCYTLNSICWDVYKGCNESIHKSLKNKISQNHQNFSNNTA